MARLLQYSLCFLLLISFVSCEQPIELEDLEFERSVVVNGIFTEGKLMTVDLVWSKSVLDNQEGFEPINEATVTVRDRSSSVNNILYPQGEGRYVSRFSPVNNHIYDLTVSIPGQPDVTATSFLPSKPQVKIQGTEINDLDDLGTLTVNFEIHDDSQNENYYIWDLVTEFEDSTVFLPSKDGTYQDWLVNYDHIADPVSAVHRRQSKLYASNQDFLSSIMNTSLTTFQFADQINGNGGSNQSPGAGSVSPDSTQIITEMVIDLRIQKVGHDLYKYYRSIERYYQNKIINTSYSDPTPIYTNINGGLGIFAGYSETRVRI